MQNKLQPRRSALYMPCSNERALEKAASLDADILIFDLEDAVAPDKKEQARNNIVAALKEKNYGYREKIVRINHVDSDWGYDDLKALTESSIEGVLLPKVESSEQINQALAILNKDIPVWVMIETPLGVLNVETIAAHNNVTVLVLGTNDLAKELRVRHSEQRDEFFYAFERCIMAARAYGCDILDGVYNQLDNESGFESVCEQGSRLGFDGKTLIHPKQIAIANEKFMPSVAAINDAKEIVQAWNNTPDKGVLVVNGRLVEALHIVAAQRLLTMVDIIAKRA